MLKLMNCFFFFFFKSALYSDLVSHLKLSGVLCCDYIFI